MSQTQPITTKFDYYSLVANLLGGGNGACIIVTPQHSIFFTFWPCVPPPLEKKSGGARCFCMPAGAGNRSYDSVVHGISIFSTINP